MKATPASKSITDTPEAVVRNEQMPVVSGPQLKLRTFKLSTLSKDVTIEMELKNEKGIAYDLTGLDEPQIVCFVVESVGGAKPIELEAEIKDAEKGVVSIKPGKLSSGVYKGAVALEIDGERITDNPITLYVTQPVTSNSGPPTMLEIRLQLRDSSLDDNNLFDSYEFTDDEIALATIKPIQYFNECSPNIGVQFNTRNFPWRYHWIEGIIAQLYAIAAEGYRKNHLSYSAGGLSVDDQNKEQNYRSAYQEKWGQFISFVRNKKGELNMEMGWRIYNGPYAYLFR